MSRPVRIRVEGVQSAINSLRAWDLRGRGKLSAAVALTALQGETHIKRLISKAGPSAPYTPPGVDTGRLRASYRHRMTAPLSGEVWTDTEYAPYLEHGTVHMAPRPHAKPTAAWMADRFVMNAREALR